MLTLTGLSKVYPNGFAALGEVNLTIEQGERVALVGSSGCGKSTLLRLIAGLSRPTHGRLQLDGEDLRGPHPKIGLIFQEPRLMPWLTVHQNVAFGLDRRQRKNPRSTRALLEMVGLSGHAADYPKQLSGGMAQRVAIARALASAPEFLLLDEPFSAVDAIKRAALQQHLTEIWSETRVSLLIVTHDVDEAILVADRILVMRPGPGHVALDLPVELPPERQRDDPHFLELRHRLIDALHADGEERSERLIPVDHGTLVSQAAN